MIQAFRSSFVARAALRCAFGGLLVATAIATSAQGVPADQWTPAERDFVQKARSLFEQQGLPYTDAQAAAAVQQMRQRNATSTRVPETQWTAQERQYIDQVRTMYQARGLPFTQEQAEQAVLAMRQQIAKLTGAAGAMQVFAQGGVLAATPGAPMPPAPTALAQPAASEAQIAAAIAAFGPKPPQVSIEQRRDGFFLNGRPVLDPEGRIQMYASDAASGLVTYAVSSSRGITVKTVGAADPSRVVVIAQGARIQGGYEFTTTSGQRLNGETFSVQPNGFLVGRSAAGFVYEAGRGVQPISVPPGWVLAPLQRGNVGATGVVLLEKELAAGAKGDELQEMLGHVQSIGSMLGLTKKEDYALFDTRGRKLYPLNISLEGKDRTFYAQCRQAKWWLQNCDKWATFEALWQQDGDRNKSHYYWRVDWAATPAGPVAAVLEGGLSDLSVIDFGSGRKVLAAQRALGIANWQLTQRGDGALTLHAKLGLEDKDIPDVTALLTAQP